MKWNFVLGVLLFLAQSCTSYTSHEGPELPPEALPGQALLYRDGGNMYTVAATGEGSELWREWKSHWSLPVWSSDGVKMAFYRFPGHDLFGTYDRHPSAALMIDDERESHAVELQAFEFPSIHYLDSYVPIVAMPQWLGGSDAVLVADKKSICRVTAAGEKELIVETKTPTVCAVMDSFRFAYITDDSLWVFDTVSRKKRGFDLRRASEFEPEEPILNVDASIDGRFLSFGQGEHLYLWDTVEESCSLLVELPEPIFGTTWFPDDKQLLVLCGYPNRRTSMRGTAQPTGEVEGRYCVYVVELPDGEVRLIYANPSSDVRGVWPRLSSDGRFVVMKDKRQKAIVVATDGKGSKELKFGRRCEAVMWRPESLTSK